MCWPRRDSNPLSLVTQLVTPLTARRDWLPHTTRPWEERLWAYVSRVCVGWVGIGNVEEVVKMTGVTGQHTPTGTGTANTEAKLASPHAATATADHTLERLVSCKYTHSLTHSLTRVAVLSACPVRVQLSPQYSLE